jgi:hypothetical protein
VSSVEVTKAEEIRDLPAAGTPVAVPPVADVPAADRKKAGAKFAAYPVAYPRMGRPETTLGRAANSWPRR